MNTTHIERNDIFKTFVTDYNYERQVKLNTLFKSLAELAQLQGVDNYNPLVKE